MIGDDHAGDLISAYLDGELDDSAAVEVRDHLQSCRGCAEVAREAELARRWMQAAPGIDATPLVETVIARRRRLVGTGLAFVGTAGVVLAALALTASVSHPRVVPDVAAMVSAHVSSAHEDVGGMREATSVGRPYVAPVAVGDPDEGLHRTVVYDGRDVASAVYSSGEIEVSVFEQPGRADWSGMPEEGLVAMAGRTVWIREGAPTVLVTEVGDLVVTVVADSAGAGYRVLAGLPRAERSSVLERLHDSCQRLMGVFALGP